MLHKKPKVKKHKTISVIQLISHMLYHSVHEWMPKTRRPTMCECDNNFQVAAFMVNSKSSMPDRGNTQVVWLKLDLGVSRLGISTPDHCLQKVPSSFCN